MFYSPFANVLYWWDQQLVPEDVPPNWVEEGEFTLCDGALFLALPWPVQSYGLEGHISSLSTVEFRASREY
jgi:hypothetical protein